MNRTKTQSRPWARAVALIIGLTGGSLSQVYAGPIIYSQDPTLSDFTSTVTSYATFTAASSGTIPYTPTTAILLAANYPREIGNSGSPIFVSFSSATADILAFDNIDHPGYGWDVFQYKIYGSTTGLAGSYTLLFDPETVNEANDPGVDIAFTLATWSGTAPTLLNDTVTAGLGSFVGNIGYEEYFNFGSSTYQYYEFAPSTLTLTPGGGGENEAELSAVAIGVPSPIIIGTAAPEPGSFLFAVTGLGALLASVGRRKLKI